MLRSARLLCLTAAGLACLAAPSLAADWNRFRGPAGAGISPDAQALPDTWSETENLRWKRELPGPGSSSPIVVGNRVFVTCWSGYGTSRGNPGDQQDLRRHLLCIDAATGDVIWDREVEAVLPEDEYGGMFAEHGYASHTPVSDGERVYVFFGKTGALAFDMDGNRLWQTGLGTESDPRGWGSASSPILHENLLIVTASAESEALVALDKRTGAEVWRKEAAGFSGTWGTPLLVDCGEGRTDLVLAVPFEMWAFNPADGKLRWFCEAIPSDSMCSSVIAHDGIVYAAESGPRGGGTIAVRAGGQGDVAATHVLWKGSERSRVGTPVYHDGRLYWISGRIATCIDASTGKLVYQQRLSGSADAAGSTGGGPPGSGAGGRPGGGPGRGGPRGGQDYSSPVAADGKLYYVGRSGEAFVLKLGPEFVELARNRFASDTSDYSATPAISDGRLFIRSAKALYCVGAAAN